MPKSTYKPGDELLIPVEDSDVDPPVSMEEEIASLKQTIADLEARITALDKGQPSTEGANV